MIMMMIIIINNNYFCGKNTAMCMEPEEEMKGDSHSLNPDI